MEKSCVKCGVKFSKPRKISTAQWSERKFCSKRCSATKICFSHEDVIAMYNSGYSSIELSSILEISGAHILRILRKYCKTRNSSEAQKNAWAKPRKAATGSPCKPHVKEILKNRIGEKNHNWGGGITTSAQGYLVYTASVTNGDRAGKLLHRVIAEENIRPLMPGEVVHHIDHNKKNNEVSNLKIMSHSEHARLHAKHSKLGVKQCLEA